MCVVCLVLGCGIGVVWWVFGLRRVGCLFGMSLVV